MTALDAGPGPCASPGGPEPLSVEIGGTTVSGLLRPGTRLARITGVAGATAEAVTGFVAAAEARGCVAVRAELPEGDPAATVCAAAGFTPVDPAVHARQPARPVLRLERPLPGADRRRSLPYFAQTTWFTCGPVALMLAAHRLGRPEPVGRRAEVALWREATTVHAPGGPGGCEPFGIACAAARRGLRTRVISTIEGPFLMDRTSDPYKRDLMLFVQSEFRAEARERGVDVQLRAWADADLAATIAAGGVAIVLIDQIVFQGHPMPHWVLVHGAGAGTWWLDDPWVDEEAGETDTDKFDVPVLAAELDRMAWYGATPYRAAVLIEPG